jgi:ABC-type multidrug transport system fused ATPase/permease subunit
MRTLAALLVLFALLASLAAGYCLWTGFVVTASVQTVFQQIALGVAATALFALALVFLAGAAVATLEQIGDELVAARQCWETEYHRRTSSL